MANRGYADWRRIDCAARYRAQKNQAQGGSPCKCSWADSIDLALWCALNQVVAAYWADVDENGGLVAHEFYLPQGLFVIGNNRFEGKDKIEAFYARRRHGTVATRHLLCNLRAFDDSKPNARIVGVMSLYRADGKSLFQGARPIRDDRRFRGALRARRRPAVAFSTSTGSGLFIVGTGHAGFDHDQSPKFLARSRSLCPAGGRCPQRSQEKSGRALTSSGCAALRRPQLHKPRTVRKTTAE